MDLGLERAGWRVLAFSEIEPYPSAVLARHWPEVPNLGDIVALVQRYRAHADGPGPEGRQPTGQDPHRPDWFDADLWVGGFPCTDLSIAGKRRGLGLDHGQGHPHDGGLRRPDGDGGRPADAGREPDERPSDDGGDGSAYNTRSGLAFAFLDLVRSALLDGRGPEFILLENVPGLLSSHKGRDMAALLGALVDLGYGVAFRTLDARYTGVPQRRRRVFILGVRVRDDDPDGHLAAQRAAEILALTASGCRHTAKGGAQGPGAAPAPRTGLEIAGGLTRRYGKGVNTTLDDGALVVGEAPDPGGDGAADGPAGRLDDSPGLASSVSASAGHHGHSSPRGDGSDNLVVGTLREHVRPGSNTDHTVYSIVPEGGQGADLRATEVDTAPSVTTEGAKQNDRGVRVVKPAVFIKKTRPHGPDGDGERWDTDEVNPTLNRFDAGDSRAVTLIAPTVNSNKGGGWRMDADQAESLVLGGAGDEDALLPDGLDSHRYRACGNAVVVNVAEWLGRRIRLAAEGVI